MKFFRFFTVYIFSAVMVLLFFSGSVAANSDSGDTPVEVPAALGPEAMGELVSKLDQEQTDALVKLMGLINTGTGNVPNSASGISSDTAETFKKWGLGFRDAIFSNFDTFPEMVRDAGTGIATVFSDRDAGGSLLFFGILVLVTALGLLAEWLFNRATAKQLQQFTSISPDTLLETLKVLFMRALIQIGGVIAFTVTALVAAELFYSAERDLLIVSTLLLYPVLITRLISALLLLLLAPNRPDLRMVSVEDQTAQYLYRNLVYIAGFVGIGMFLRVMMQYNDSDTLEVYRFFYSIIVVSWVIYLTWRARSGLTSIIIGEDENSTPGLEKMAAWWPIMSIAIIILAWLLIQIIVSTGNITLTPGRGGMALVLIVAMPFLDTMVRGISSHLVPPMLGEGPVAEKAYLESRHSYVRIGRLFLFAFFILLLGKLLGANLGSLAEQRLGAEIASNSVGFILILAVGYLAWEVTNLWINRSLVLEIPQEATETEGGDAGGTGLSRMATILPIVHMTLQALIVTLTLLLALSQLGVNITPLLAGAGVLGLAIGFGAQTLVKDIVSGVFFLLDDAFRVGEYVDVGGIQGTVEKILVRSLQLRGATGSVHFVPYGSISRLTNMSRDWVIMKLKFTIPFDADIDKVRKLFKKIGQEMMEVPELAKGMLEPFKSQGAADVTDVGIVVRGKFTTVPGGQWTIRKEVYTRVQKAFEENGIEFARKEVRVQLPGRDAGAPLTPDQEKVIATAASEAAESPPLGTPTEPDPR